jgi:subtilase family serine protease
MSLKRVWALTLIVVALVAIAPIAAQQSAAIPPDKSVASKALLLQRVTGAALPVVSPATIAAIPAARPTVWLTRPLGNAAMPTAFVGEPSFCEHQFTNFYVFCPKGIQTAYGLGQIVGANGGAGLTIAIVDAYAYPYAEANLAQFNADMGLPPCTTANGCFKSVNLSPFDGSGSGWDLEAMLDLEYAHAAAPNAKLVFVQAYDNSYDNLGVAVGIAAGQSDIVSNSWSGGEYPAYDFYWNVGKPLLFSSGDNGSWPSQGFVGYPCSANTVTCVGGTSLYVNASLQRTAEIAWSGSGGGCSGAEPIPYWQGRNGSGICGAYRASPDISAVADPNTGVAVYMNNPYWTPGYYLVGGTSLASPVLAGVFADITAARVSFGKAKFTFLNPSVYDAAASNYPYFNFDVVSGSNGYPAGPQFDLATGLGVPVGKNMANRFFGLK